jgi:hypothetical protein
VKDSRLCSRRILVRLRGTLRREGFLFPDRRYLPYEWMMGGRLSGPVRPLQRFAALNVGRSLAIPTRPPSSEPVIRNKRSPNYLSPSATAESFSLSQAAPMVQHPFPCRYFSKHESLRSLETWLTPMSDSMYSAISRSDRGGHARSSFVWFSATFLVPAL